MKRGRQQGVMLLEALVAILIFSIGILAIVGMQASAVRAVTDSRSRSEASFFANQLIALRAVKNLATFREHLSADLKQTVYTPRG